MQRVLARQQPNWFLDSHGTICAEFLPVETFTELKRNGIVGVDPDVIAFEGFRVGSTHHTTLVSGAMSMGEEGRGGELVNVCVYSGLAFVIYRGSPMSHVTLSACTSSHPTPLNSRSTT